MTEKFTPHDIVLSITTPEELSDAALTAACTLHTAAPSTSSSSGSSARGQKLSWIREESEAPGHPAGDDFAALQRPPTASSAIPTILEPTSSNEEDPLRSGSVVSQTIEQFPVVLDEEAVEEKPVADVKPTPEISHVTIETVTQGPRTPEADDLSDFRETLTSYDKLFEGSPEPRASSQTARPDYNELYEHYYAQYTKPKEKLGPRPRASLEGRRPSTSGSGSQPGHKAKSSLPSGLRSSNRKATEKKKPTLKEPASAPNLTAATLPPPPSPIPETPISPISVTFSLKSPASVRSMPMSTTSGYRSNGNSKEKARLMKALEMRKKQLKAQQDRQSKLADVAVESEQTKEQNTETKPFLDYRDPMTDASKVESNASAEDASATTAVLAHDADEAVIAQTKGDCEDRKISLEEDTTSSLAVDSSGMVHTSNQPENEDLNSAASVSSPVSAQTQGSSVAPSTRPSSLSEDDHNNMDDGQKAAHLPEHATWDTLDEQQSDESTPTVVPESKTPVPSLDMQMASGLPTPPADAPPDSNETQTSKRESTTTLMPSNTQDQSRRSNRESTVYMPPEEYTPQSDHPNRRNRESMILPSSKRQSWYQTKEKRRALLDPIQVSAENSEAEYLSDDSFMEELRSAEVRQAQPMSVSKSPIVPYFPPRQSTEPKLSSPPKRTQSTSLNKATRSSPEQLARKSSGPWITSTRSEDMPPPAKMNSVKVSGGIAQRIKALAEKSKRDSQASLSPLDQPRSRPGSSLAQRKSNFFAASEIERSPGGTPLRVLGSPSYLSLSSQTTPDKKPVLEPSPIPAEQPVYNLQQVEQPETVQVTARIIQDDRTKQPTLAMPTEATPLDLHQSPLIIDHQKPTFVPKSPVRVKTAPAAAMEPASPRLPSSSSRDQPTSLPRSSSESSWRSFGRRMSESKSLHSPDGEDEKRDDKKGKKDSRTTKLFKRMSSGLGLKGSQSSLSSPEQSSQSTSLSSLREPPPPVQVGEVNIQFPDTLVSSCSAICWSDANISQLWKRRFAEIDAAGNLILGPSISNPRGITKRFHLTDFTAPYPPDQDQQELPFSVCLDFVDGRTLQCACESSTSQAHVLQSKFHQPLDSNSC